MELYPSVRSLHEAYLTKRWTDYGWDLDWTRMLSARQLLRHTPILTTILVRLISTSYFFSSGNVVVLWLRIVLVLLTFLRLVVVATAHAFRLSWGPDPYLRLKFIFSLPWSLSSMSASLRLVNFPNVGWSHGRVSLVSDIITTRPDCRRIIEGGKSFIGSSGPISSFWTFVLGYALVYISSGTSWESISLPTICSAPSSSPFSNGGNNYNYRRVFGMRWGLPPSMIYGIFWPTKGPIAGLLCWRRTS